MRGAKSGDYTTVYQAMVTVCTSGPCTSAGLLELQVISSEFSLENEVFCRFFMQEK